MSASLEHYKAKKEKNHPSWEHLLSSIRYYSMGGVQDQEPHSSILFPSHKELQS
jgi:hypothetical protein